MMADLNGKNEVVDLIRWYCARKRHILGVVFKEGGKGSGLILFRHAVPSEGDVTGARQAGLFYGELHVTCDLCEGHGVVGKEAVRTFWPGEYELNRLLRKVKAGRNR